jgi:glutamyl-tRNA synthetase
VSVRVRFAPNPSGRLHVGSAHTALFNWLFARHQGGTFILRIEDTDQERARAEFVDPICDGLLWLGLDWDEGPRVGGPHEPYVSSQRVELYRETARKLEAAGAVYRCWCTRDDIKARGRESGYDRFCRRRTDTPSGPYTLRLAVPDGRAVEFDDLILGRLRREYEELMDPVLVRSDGTPLYHLAVTADDIAMGITHIIRSTDLLDGSFIQVLLYEALGADMPPLAHVPLVLGPDRSKLGKRHGSESLQEFGAEGFLSEAVLNQLALLGWSSPSLEEILSKSQLIEEFTIERVNPSPSIFDHTKLRWMNSEYIKTLAPGDFEGRVVELLPDVPRDVLHSVIELGLIQTRVETLAEIPSMIRYLHTPVSIDPAAAGSLASPEAVTTLEEAASRLESLETWEPAAIKDCVLGLIADLGLNRRKGPLPLYVAISGTTTALPLFESMCILGRGETVSRLRAALP